MKKIKIYNSSKSALIADDLILADNFFTRFRGLLGKKSISSGQGAMIIPCNSVHSFGMKFSIDVFFVTSENVICHIIEDMKPMRVSPIVKGSKYVVELPAGSADAKNIAIGDQIEIDPY